MTGSQDYRLYLSAEFKTINEKLDTIDGRLKNLNSKVAEHEKIINQNLPHTIIHCPQVEIIEDLKENMITGRTILNTLYIGFGILGGLIALIWGITEIFFT